MTEDNQGGIQTDELVNAAYKALLNREPDPMGAAYYSSKIKNATDYIFVLQELLQSDEFLVKQVVRQHAGALVGLTYVGLLERKPDSEGFLHWKCYLEKTGDFSGFISAVAASSERQDVLIRYMSQRLERCSAECGNEAIVFLHAHKTAGTSFQNFLIQAFGEALVYHEHADTLYFRSPYQLRSFTVFAGHFNYDSLHYIPRTNKSLLTIVRDPKERLVSLYNFLLAHNPEHPSWDLGMELANNLNIIEFLQHPKIHELSGCWNHMTWVVMGERFWRECKYRLTDESSILNEAERRQLIISIRNAIRERLSKFLWVGIHEKFDASMRLLCEQLNLPYEEPLPRDHSLTSLIAEDPHFKKSMVRQTISEVSPRMFELMELDYILYEEADAMFSHQQSVFAPSSTDRLKIKEER